MVLFVAATLPPVGGSVTVTVTDALVAEGQAEPVADQVIII
jgi:hypothetical protein